MELKFGKYRGKSLPDVPTGYLEWLVGAPGIWDEVRDAARAELDERRRVAAAGPSPKPPPAPSPPNVPPPPSPPDEPLPPELTPDGVVVLREFIDAGYHILSRRHHPDQGGSHDAQVALNKRIATVRAWLDAWRAYHRELAVWERAYDAWQRELDAWERKYRRR